MLPPPILMVIVRWYVNSVLARILVYQRVSSLSRPLQRVLLVQLRGMMNFSLEHKT